MHRFPAIIVALLAVLALGFLFAACEDDTGDQLREASTDTRHEGQAAAIDLHGEPQKVNFPAYEAVVEFSNRTDLANHPWYIYILGETGNVVGHFVATTKPINSCTFLSSSQDVDSSQNGKVILQAPSLDGTFAGGSGGSAACDAEFFFDATTGALIEINTQYFVADQPLLLDAEAIQVDAAPLPAE